MLHVSVCPIRQDTNTSLRGDIMLLVKNINCVYTTSSALACKRVCMYVFMYLCSLMMLWTISGSTEILPTNIILARSRARLNARG